jgi:hypothetical protein
MADSFVAEALRRRARTASAFLKLLARKLSLGLGGSSIHGVEAARCKRGWASRGLDRGGQVAIDEKFCFFSFFLPKECQQTHRSCSAGTNRACAWFLC